MATKFRILALHDASLVRRAIAKALSAVPDISVASSSARSNMFAYLLAQYKPDYILRSTAALTPHETAVFGTFKKDHIISAIPFADDDLVSDKQAADFAQTILKQLSSARQREQQTSAPTPSRAKEAKPVRSATERQTGTTERETTVTATEVPPPPAIKKHFNKVIFCGASTGGTEALKVFLMGFPAESPPILITQHMPEGFTHSFADRLNRACAISVVEAIDKDPVVSGRAYIAPGHSHLYVERINGALCTRLSQEPPVNRHRPSVEVLFLSAATVVGKNAIGVMFTGMGKDGALAMLKMREAGAYNTAQDEASSVVYGMPREAVFVGAVQEILPLPDISARVLALVDA